MTLTKDRRILRDTALESISIALRETQIYYRDLGRGDSRNMDREAQLVKLWSVAAIPLRHIDQDLALICDQKAEYWLTPEQWTEQEIISCGIRLEDVTRAYRQLAMPRTLSSRRRMNVSKNAPPSQDTQPK